MPLDQHAVPAYAVVRFRRQPDAPAEPGLLVDGTVHPLDLAALGATSINELFATWGASKAALDAVAAEPGIPLADVTLTAPVEPGQVLQTGANYRTHVIDLEVSHRTKDDPRTEDEARADAARIMDDRAAHGEPYFFIAVPRTVAGPDAPLALPAWSDKHDWELELAVIIGSPAFRVTREQALEHVWGYTIVNDITTRDVVFRRDMPAIGTDWYRAKNSPGFNPTGPFAVPADRVPAPTDIHLRLDVNGTTMQDASTSDLLFDVPALIAAASQIAPLEAGDLLLTGSPAGNGQARGIFLHAGDVMIGTIEGLGTQTLHCTAEASE